MTEDLFLDWALKLLEQIETSEEKKLWCRRYSVYSRSPGQETLSRNLHDFVDRTYQAGLVIQNYHEVIQKWGLEERNIAIAPPGWLETQPYDRPFEPVDRVIGEHRDESLLDTQFQHLHGNCRYFSYPSYDIWRCSARQNDTFDDAL